MNFGGNPGRNLFGGAREAQEPDVLVGIDIGTCFTKVAYAIRRNGEYDDIRNIQDWPNFGSVSEDDTRCIDTTLAYRKGQKIIDNAPLFCGRLGPEQRRDKYLDIYEWFKEDFPGDVTIRTSSRNTNGNTTWNTNISPENAASTDTMILYKEFLERLYAAISNEIRPQLDETPLPNWMNAHIEFIFSVPATWNRVDETLSRISSKLVDVAKMAGFGGEAKHIVSIGLTEPEAAAAYSLAFGKGDIQNGQNILVVDAGGGTTDLCLIHVENPYQQDLKIDSKSPPIGENLGSLHIDRGFEELAMERLRELSYQLKPIQDWELGRLSHAMRYDTTFQQNKRKLDSEIAAGSNHFTVNGPDLDNLQGCEESPLVNNGKIKFTQHELAGLFDNVIDDRSVTIDGYPATLPGINKLIRRARGQIRYQGRTSSDIDTILLSGGLGQSKYLKHRIEQALENDQEAGRKIPRVITVPEPQLSVSRGLLHNRRWKLFGARKCNGNYGILYLTKFKFMNPRHQIARKTNQTTKIGGKTFVNEINWLVKKGDAIPPTPLKHVYTFEQEEETIVKMVVSLDDKPKTFSNPGKDIIAEVHCNSQKLRLHPISDKKHCDVEISFGIGKVDVKCWSPTKEGGNLVGDYSGLYGRAASANTVG